MAPMFKTAYAPLVGTYANWNMGIGSVRRKRTRAFERDTLRIARTARTAPKPKRTFRTKVTTRYPRVSTLRHYSLRAIQDARQLGPPADAPRRRPITARTLTGGPFYSLATPPAPFVDVPSTVSFADPGRIVACVRRKRRAEVLHALKKTGRGSGGGPKHRNFSSDISCR